MTHLIKIKISQIKQRYITDNVPNYDNSSIRSNIQINSTLKKLVNENVSMSYVCKTGSTQ